MQIQELFEYFPGLFYAFGAVLGVVIGSFLNVVVYRVPRGLAFHRGRSFCPACGRTLTAADLVPVLSWLCLRGKCRGCGAPISPRYPAVELAGGLFALAALAVWGPTLRALAVFAALCVLLCVALCDHDTMEIPNGLTLFLLLPAAVLAFTTPASGLLSHAIGAVCVSLPMLLLALVLPGSFGGGDIKLMFVCGLALGWRAELVGLFLALVIGGIQGVWLLGRKRAGRKAQFAFGPALCAGAAAALLWGDAIFAWYAALL